MDTPDAKHKRAAWAKRLLSTFETSGSTSHNLWLTVYSDMMTNLMLFFLAMFSLNLLGEEYVQRATKAFNASVRGEDIPEGVSFAISASNPLAQYLGDLKEKRKDVQVIEQGEGARLRLPEPVLFDLGRADLKPEAKTALHEIAVGLKTLRHSVVVEGHTDDVPVSKNSPYKDNWTLSEARAEAVVNYLVAEEGIVPDRLSVAAYGEHWPFVPNDSPLNRTLNRRIELLLILDEKA